MGSWAASKLSLPELSMASHRVGHSRKNKTKTCTPNSNKNTTLEIPPLSQEETERDPMGGLTFLLSRGGCLGHEVTVRSGPRCI